MIEKIRTKLMLRDAGYGVEITKLEMLIWRTRRRIKNMMTKQREETIYILVLFVVLVVVGLYFADNWKLLPWQWHKRITELERKVKPLEETK